MRKRGRKMWWVVPCRSKRSLQTESRMDIDQILKAKLETITEESEISEDNCMVQFSKHRCSMMKKERKFYVKLAMGEGFRPRIGMKLKDSYLLFMSGFVSKRCLGALPQC
ncbi:hypothetical protein CTI12_AA074300 [Artemisia annua]|uniref:Uncharacterized protein n=1 Tax=Artemisia annua TaxID=35608 RepID=A0A2U1Q4C2_ARTAN|nr:hypothetical protein CTI12_AA624870 [Artemisia annua]PWA92827.1 hypothetical protein CTI12_AA074300 [Artemisia annua]